MTRLRAGATLLVVLLIVLTACTSDQGGTDTSVQAPFAVDIDVNTPLLRTLKQDAGIEPCRPGNGTRPATEAMPELRLACLGGGRAVDLSTLHGPLVVNLWASWCGPCREELPYYQRLHEEAGGKVDVLGIDYEDTQPDAALELASEAGVTYPLLADPGGGIHVPFEVRALPGVVFVDREGSITHIEYVVIRSYEQLRDLVDEHLDVTL